MTAALSCNPTSNCPPFELFAVTLLENQSNRLRAVIPRARRIREMRDATFIPLSTHHPRRGTCRDCGPQGSRNHRRARRRDESCRRPNTRCTPSLRRDHTAGGTATSRVRCRLLPPRRPQAPGAHPIPTVARTPTESCTSSRPPQESGVAVPLSFASGYAERTTGGAAAVGVMPAGSRRERSPAATTKATDAQRHASRPCHW